MRALSAFLVILMTSLVLATASPVRDGDVTIDASSEPNVPCADCPGGAGTRLTYEVTLAANAENNGIEDFHLEVNDARADHFGCPTIEQWSPHTQQWDKAFWTASHESQIEGKRNAHYLSFYRDEGGEVLSRGETFRFSFVYCGSRNNLDESIEYIATDDGTNRPAVPDGSGDRANVPDSNGSDDPAWAGTSQKAPGSDVGFVSCPTGEDMTCELLGTPQPGQVVQWICQVANPGSVSPSAFGQVLLSVTGTDRLPVPGSPVTICLTPDAITAMVLSFGPLFQAPLVNGSGVTPPLVWPNVPPGIRVFSTGVTVDLQNGSIPWGSPTYEWLSQ